MTARSGRCRASKRKGLEDLVECILDTEEIAVVDEAAVELLGEFAKGVWPGGALGCHAHLDGALDDHLLLDLDGLDDHIDRG